MLNQYLATPQAQQAEAAKLLLREIKLVTSVAEATAMARDLGDEPLRAYLQQGVEPLVAAIETVELRPIYERTLLQAFRQENNRRQMIPRGAFAQNPEPADAARSPRTRMNPRDRPRKRIPIPAKMSVDPPRGPGLDRRRPQRCPGQARCVCGKDSSLEWAFQDRNQNLRGERPGRAGPGLVAADRSKR